jgi:hypothetical protein
MSVINQMLRDLDKQQAAGRGSLPPAPMAGSRLEATVGLPLWRLLAGVTCIAVLGYGGWSFVVPKAAEPAANAAVLPPIAQPVERSLAQPREQSIEQATTGHTVAVVASPPDSSETAARQPQVVPTAVPSATVVALAAGDSSFASSQPAATQHQASELKATAAPVTSLRQTPSRELSVLNTPVGAASDSDMSVTEISASESNAEAFAAAPAGDLSAQPAAIKQPSRMHVEKVVQDPQVLATAKARVQQQQQVQQLLQLARQASQQQQWPQVLQLLQQIPPESFSADSWQLQANAQQQSGDFSSALASWQQLLQLKPQLAQAWLGKALAHDQLAQLPQARAAYQQAYALPGLSVASRQFIQQRLAQQ